ncbi:MAG: PilZ domain-containing protein [Thermodesulfobacteriota bacterium]
MSDRRKYERYLIQKLALLQLANGNTLQGQTLDMGEGGALIQFETDNDLTLGESYRVNLLLDEEDEETLTEVEGQVSHLSSNGVGFTFLKINSTYYQFMEELSD